MTPKPQAERWERLVSDDEKVGMHRLEVFHHVLEALPLGQTGGLGAHADNGGTETSGRKLEGGSGAGRGVKEQVDHRFSLERLTPPPPLIPPGKVEDANDLFSGKFLNS